MQTIEYRSAQRPTPDRPESRILIMEGPFSDIWIISNITVELSQKMQSNVRPTLIFSNPRLTQPTGEDLDDLSVPGCWVDVSLLWTLLAGAKVSPQANPGLPTLLAMS